MQSEKLIGQSDSYSIRSSTEKQSLKTCVLLSTFVTKVRESKDKDNAYISLYLFIYLVGHELLSVFWLKS